MEETLGKRIVSNRKRLGLTQDQLAEKLGVTAQAVSKWENDLSCPDISVLPMLADIFGITVDALLGRESAVPVVDTEVVDDDQEEDADPGFQWQWQCESKKGSLGLAALVLSVGVLLLLSALFSWGLSFWSALWPTALLIFGLFTMFPRFSFLSLGCTLLGSYFLVDNIVPLNVHVESSVIWAVMILLFGISILIDAIRKKKRKSYKHLVRNGQKGKRSTKRLKIEDGKFEFDASFAEAAPLIAMPLMHHGNISVNFGDYCVDLQAVEAVTDNCTLEANCSFGELRILVPSRFLIKCDHSTAFAGFSIEGKPDATPAGIIHVAASASFGEIHIVYI